MMCCLGYGEVKVGEGVEVVVEYSTPNCQADLL